MQDLRDHNSGVGKHSSLPVTLRRMARWLELRSFGLTPEHFTLAEARRAAVAVAVPLVLVVGSGQYHMGWAIFASFWTCLCDSPGSDKQRRFQLLLFALCGTLIAFVGAWVASLGYPVPLIAGPLLVFASVLLPSRLPHSGMVSTLLAVVSVVAVGFPKPLVPAALQALAFLGGSLWAFVLITWLMRIDPWLPVRQSASAVLMRLTDMVSDLVVTADRPHRDYQWHPDHATHRRSVRMAIERLRLLMVRYQGAPAKQFRPFATLHHSSETIFSALIALDHAFIVKKGRSEDRIACAFAILDALNASRAALKKWSASEPVFIKALERLHQASVAMQDETLKGCLLAVEQALRRTMLPFEQPQAVLSFTHSAHEGVMPLNVAFRHALRQATAVLAVYYVALIFSFGYPYWATMAVVVVLQGAARFTWTRGVERILGSSLGGILTLGFLHFVDQPLILALIVVPLAGLTIALRSVNYTVFVLFLTMLFIMVTEMLQSGAGVASARIVDNTVGSLTALVAILVLWPDFGSPLSALIQEGLRANQAYLDAVESGADLQTIIKARRAAGLASTAAEVAIHDLGGLLRRFNRVSEEDGAALRDLRLLAGEAAGAWHRRLQQNDKP
ncbi:putative membrane protein YccC [Agrobacterium vitis]|nr:putative membrane protein YccC [Agrobacterium vitis]